MKSERDPAIPSEYDVGVQRIATGDPLLADIERELEPGEYLIWANRPRNLIAHARTKVRTFSIGVVFAAFASIFIANASSAPVTLIMIVAILVGILFFLVGIGLMLSPLWAIHVARQTLYALTDRRVIVKGAGAEEAWIIEGLDVADITCSQHRDGTGDVIFAKTRLQDADVGLRVIDHGFYGIVDAKWVEYAICRMRSRQGEMTPDKTANDTKHIVEQKPFR